MMTITVKQVMMPPSRFGSEVDESQRFDPEQIAAERFRTILGSMVSMPTNNRSYEQFRDVAKSYASDWQVLTKCREEWMQFLRRVVEIQALVGEKNNFGTARRQAEESVKIWQDELLRGIVWPLEVRTALEASLADLMTNIAAESLRQSLLKTVSLTADAMASHLTILVEQGVLGCIQWYGKRACQYSYFDRNIEATVTSRFPAFAGVNYAPDTKRSFFDFMYEGVSDFRMMAHCHDIIDVVKAHPRNAMSTIPKRQQQMIDATPAWLDGHVAIVEGTLIRNREIVKEVGSKLWTELVEVPACIGFDPAIVLSDSYVLTGWLPQPVVDNRHPLTKALAKLF